MKKKDSLYWGLLFICGGVSLSLEILASRIMTPYFGVSLYIWAGILSITLIFLAVGYYLGGLVSQQLNSEKLLLGFLTAPMIASFSILISSALYPFLFPSLTHIGLVSGSFVGSALLLALPLVALSAMNPLLIAYLSPNTQKGDNGAGKVFFISTIGSVVGVLVTAFVFIPNLGNFKALLLLGFSMSLSGGLLTFLSSLSHTHKKWLLTGYGLTALLCVFMILGQKTFIQYSTSTKNKNSPFSFQVRGEYHSLFGNLKVLQVHKNSTNHKKNISWLNYVQDGLIQNNTTLDGQSLDAFTYTMELLGLAVNPKAHNTLVLGMGAGTLPASLKNRGLNVDIVEINPDALDAAIQFFHFNPNGINIYLEDARTFINRCNNRYDIIFVDLFHGDGTPDYLLTSEFFSNLNHCLVPNGTVVTNFHFDKRNETLNHRIMATLATAFSHITEAQLPTDIHTAIYNDFLVATNVPVPLEMNFSLKKIPIQLRPIIRQALSNLRTMGPENLVGIVPVTDDYNVFSILSTQTHMTLRQHMVDNLPATILIN